MNPIQARIINLRKEKGISQEDMADELCLTPSGYSKVEIGDNEITVNRLEKIARILNVKPSYLAGWEEVAIPNEKLNQANISSDKLIDMYMKLTDSYIKLIEEKDQRIALLEVLLNPVHTAYR